ncbi:MAG: hypothetical protein ACXACG_16520 [Candidatus Thorarchaeota archaeon]
MVDENSRDRLFKAVRKRIKESDEQDRILLIANAIGDRRYRDLVDIVANIESEDGWSTTLELLMKAQNQNYASPITIGQDKTNLEELKYREMVFELLSCSGLEPITTGTTELLKKLDGESSLVDASRVLVLRLEELAVEQIQTGDTLFFDFSENVSVSQVTVNLLNKVRSENIRSISLEQSENLINIEPLWYCEYGRLALSTLGVKGSIVDSDTFDSVLSVIQAPKFNKPRIVEVSSFADIGGSTRSRPSNSVYRKLHTHLIHHKVNELSLLASRHSVPLLNTLLDEVSSAYEDSSSTTGYKEILDYINAHISVRNVESILVLEKSSQMKNTRIATTAILAIGNFYHESSAATLVKLYCTQKNDEIEKVVAKAIENVYKKCPEADRVIADSLDTECRNRGKLKKLYRHLNKEKPLYYQ